MDLSVLEYFDIEVPTEEEAKENSKKDLERLKRFEIQFWPHALAKLSIK